jgi:Spy/CpxP family protein refolding chaperone
MRTLCTVLALAVTLSVCGKAHAQGARDRLVEQLQDLNLTDAQETKIASIRSEYHGKIQQAGQQLATIVKDEMEKVRAALTPQQRVKTEDMKDERRERRHEGLAERIAHLEALDLTDAEMTKIEAIRAQYRPKIEKAMEELHGTLTPAQRTAREDAVKAGKKHREMLAALNLNATQREKVETVGKEVATLFREELEKIRDVLNEEQQGRIAEFRDERTDRVRDHLAARIANLRDLNLTDAQKASISSIRLQFRPKVHEAGNQLRADVREEIDKILAALKA